MSRPVAVVSLALAAGLLVAGCGDKAVVQNTAAIQPLPASTMPARINGLHVTAEPLAPLLKGVKESDAVAAGFYALRLGRTLEATLQVTRFREREHASSPAVQQRVVNQIGASEPTLTRLPEGSAYLSLSNDQRLGVWFRGATMYVLTVRSDYPYPRSLIRSALAVTR